MSDKKTILLIDDDSDLLENTSFMVKSAGFDVLTGENGIEAVEKYKEFSPNLVIMDVKMPKMDGFDAFFKIKQYDPDAKVILITAYSIDEKKHLKAQNLGLLTMISKPYSFDIIEEIVSKYA